MNVVDLPEPKRSVPASPEQKIRRQWGLVVAFLWLTALYATLHKGLMPLFLGFTSLSGSPYAQFNAWFLHPLLLAILASHANRLSPGISLLAGAGVAHGVAEILSVAQGHATGWMAFSHLLSAVPFAIVCTAMLTGPYPGKHYRAAWTGAAIVLLLTLGEARWL